MLHPFLIQKFATYNLTSFLEGVYTEASELKTLKLPRDQRSVSGVIPSTLSFMRKV